MGPLAWHGVLAPEGVWSGDGRQFKEGSLRFRDLPLPLTWQKSAQPGHDGSVVVGKIERIERVGSQMLGEGTFLSTPEADEAVGLVAEFGRFGVSVDADEAAMELNEDTGQRTFTDAQIVSASMVPIPAFAGSYVTLGPMHLTASCRRCCAGGCRSLEEVSTMAWDGSCGQVHSRAVEEVLRAARGGTASTSPPQTPHPRPGRQDQPGRGARRRGTVQPSRRPSEAKAKAKAALRGAYKQIGDEPYLTC